VNLEWLPTAAVIGAVITLIAALVFLWWWVPKKQADRLRMKIRDPKARADVEDNFRKTLSQLLGGIAVLLGAGFAYNQSQLAAKASSELLISQQTSKGFEQLGSNNIIVRLGGIYALEGVMNTSLAYHKPIVEALAAFVREKTPTKLIPTPDGVFIGSDSPSPPPLPTDVQAALTVLGRRIIQKNEGTISLGASNLHRAILFEANLARADLINATLTRANLFKANLIDAILVEADLRRAFLVDADLSFATLISATLIGANLDHSTLRGANLSNVDLTSATLRGADLRNADLTSATLVGADLSNAILTGATLTGVDLSKIRCNSNTKFPPGLAVSCKN
jgi:uncharacterized protein YjbI with pentapeptide repeats